MTKRLDILKASLEKKKEKFATKLADHFDDVRSANGQPMNDKRNGHVTLDRWEKQNDALRNLKKETEKTERAIEHEQGKIKEVQAALETLPQPILDKIADGTLTQWRKHPTIFFVVGVDKARLQWEKENSLLVHRYVSQIPDKDQHRKFAVIFNELRALLLVSNPLKKG